MNRSYRAAPVLVCGVAVFGVASAGACGPRKPAASPTTAAVPTAATTGVATPTSPTSSPPPPTSTAPTSATTAPTAVVLPPFTIPSAFPGFPAGVLTSPREAILGKWTVTAIDGRPVGATPGVTPNPLDPATYAAGSGVVFTADTVTFTREQLTLLSRPYKVVSELPPVRLTIDAGYGPSNVDFLPDGSALWSVPSVPPHALTLSRGH